MKTYFSYFVFSVFFCAEMYSQWQATNGPWGGEVECLVESGGILYAGTYDSLYRSSDSGATWTGFGPFGATAVVVSGNKIMAGGYSNDFYLSYNNGINWNYSSISFGSSGSDRVGDLEVIGQKIFAAIEYDGLYRSTNNGQNWQSVGAFWDVYDLLFTGTNFFAGTSDGVYVSPDSGTTWTAANSGMTQRRVESLFAYGQILYAGTDSGGIYFSSDNGITWINRSINITNSQVSNIVVNSTGIFAGTYIDGVFFSPDTGATWIRRDSGLMNFRINALISTSSSSLFAGTYGNGLFQSVNNGLSWDPVVNYLEKVSLSSISVKGQTLVASTRQSVYFSDDMGQNWRAGSHDLASDLIYCTGVLGNRIFAGTYNDGLFVTTDDGLNWVHSDSGLGMFAINTIESYGSSLYAATYGGLYTSVDSGTSWYLSGLNGLRVYSVARDSNNLYAGSEYMGLFHSSNNGISWDTLSNGLPQSQIMAIQANGQNILASVWNAGIYRSTDGGQNWSLSNLGLPYNWMTKFIKTGNDILAAGWGGVFKSSDQGATWNNMSHWLQNGWLCGIVVLDSLLYAGSGDGVWRRDLSEVITSDDLSIEAMNFTHVIQYPNPFHDQATFRLTLLEQTTASFRIYDLSGREIVELANQEFDPGVHELQWDAAGHESGIYIYQLKTACGTFTGKMTLF